MSVNRTIWIIFAIIVAFVVVIWLASQTLKPSHRSSTTAVAAAALDR